MRTPTSAALAPLAAAAALAAGCGSGSADPIELAGALPGDPELVSYLDVDAARGELDLPDDADPADYDALEGAEDREPEALLVQAAANSLPHVTESYTLTFEADATTAAIDHTQVSAAAAAQGSEGGRVAVLQTDQPFDEIAEELEAAGFERDGDVLSGESADPKPALAYVADLGDGRIVVASEQEQAEAAVAGDEEPSPAVAILAELDSPQREAATITLDGCVSAFAVGGDPGEPELELVYRVDGEAEADRVPGELDVITGVDPVALGEPEVDGDLVFVTATLESGEADVSGLFAAGAFEPAELYDCG